MNDATVIVHWLGKDTPFCNNHALKLVDLGKVLGIRVSSTPAANGEQCTNCINEAKKKAS